MELLDHREQVQPGAALGVVRGPLMRVLAVGQLELLPEPRQNASGKRSAP